MLSRIISIVAILGLMTGCRKADPGVAAIIGGRDTITAGELTYHTKRIYGFTEHLTFYERNQVLTQLADLHRNALAALDQNPSASTAIDSIVRLQYDAIFEDVFLKSEVIGKIIDSKAIARYEKFSNSQVTYQLFLVGYVSPNYPKSVRNREQAKRLMDSVARIIHYDNFEMLAQQYSEYAHPKLGKLAMVTTPYEDLPLLLQNVILSGPAHRVTSVIEIPDAFIFVRVLKIEQPSGSPLVILSKPDIAKKLTQKLINSEEYYYLLQTGIRVDELFRDAGLSIDSSAVVAGVAALKGGSTWDALRRRFDSKPLVLATLSDQPKVTFLDVMSQFSEETQIPAFDEKTVRRLLREYLQHIVVREFVTRPGTVLSENAKWEIGSRRLTYAAQMGANSFAVASPSEDEVKQYYASHPSQFVQPGESVYSEFSSYDRSTLVKADSLIRAGIEPKKIKDIINGRLADHEGSRLTVAVNEKMALSGANEVARCLTKLSKGEVSTIVPRIDGRYSIFTIVDKKSDRTMSFEESRTEAETALVHQRKIRNKWQYSVMLSRKYPIVVFDQPLH